LKKILVPKVSGEFSRKLSKMTYVAKTNHLAFKFHSDSSVNDWGYKVNLKIYYNSDTLPSSFPIYSLLYRNYASKIIQCLNERKSNKNTEQKDIKSELHPMFSNHLNDDESLLLSFLSTFTTPLTNDQISILFGLISNLNDSNKIAEMILKTASEIQVNSGNDFSALVQNILSYMQCTKNQNLQNIIPLLQKLVASLFDAKVSIVFSGTDRDRNLNQFQNIIEILSKSPEHFNNFIQSLMIEINEKFTNTTSEQDNFTCKFLLNIFSRTDRTIISEVLPIILKHIYSDLVIPLREIIQNNNIKIPLSNEHFEMIGKLYNNNTQDDVMISFAYANLLRSLFQDSQLSSLSQLIGSSKDMTTGILLVLSVTYFPPIFNQSVEMIESKRKATVVEADMFRYIIKYTDSGEEETIPCFDFKAFTYIDPPFYVDHPNDFQDVSEELFNKVLTLVSNNEFTPISNQALAALSAGYKPPSIDSFNKIMSIIKSQEPAEETPNLNDFELIEDKLHLFDLPTSDSQLWRCKGVIDKFSIKLNPNTRIWILEHDSPCPYRTYNFTTSKDMELRFADLRIQVPFGGTMSMWFFGALKQIVIKINNKFHFLNAYGSMFLKPTLAIASPAKPTISLPEPNSLFDVERLPIFPNLFTDVYNTSDSSITPIQPDKKLTGASTLVLLPEISPTNLIQENPGLYACEITCVGDNLTIDVIDRIYSSVISSYEYAKAEKDNSQIVTVIFTSSSNSAMIIHNDKIVSLGYFSKNSLLEIELKLNNSSTVMINAGQSVLSNTYFKSGKLSRDPTPDNSVLFTNYTPVKRLQPLQISNISIPIFVPSTMSFINSQHNSEYSLLSSLMSSCTLTFDKLSIDDLQFESPRPAIYLSSNRTDNGRHGLFTTSEGKINLTLFPTSKLPSKTLTVKPTEIISPIDQSITNNFGKYYSAKLISDNVPAYLLPIYSKDLCTFPISIAGASTKASYESRQALSALYATASRLLASSPISPEALFSLAPGIIAHLPSTFSGRCDFDALPLISALNTIDHKNFVCLLQDELSVLIRPPTLRRTVVSSLSPKNPVSINSPSPFRIVEASMYSHFTSSHKVYESAVSALSSTPHCTVTRGTTLLDCSNYPTYLEVLDIDKNSYTAAYEIISYAFEHCPELTKTMWEAISQNAPYLPYEKAINVWARYKPQEPPIRNNEIAFAISSLKTKTTAVKKLDQKLTVTPGNDICAVFVEGQVPYDFAKIDDTVINCFGGHFIRENSAEITFKVDPKTNSAKVNVVKCNKKVTPQRVPQHFADIGEQMERLEMNPIDFAAVVLLAAPIIDPVEVAFYDEGQLKALLPQIKPNITKFLIAKAVIDADGNGKGYEDYVRFARRLNVKYDFKNEAGKAGNLENLWRVAESMSVDLVEPLLEKSEGDIAAGNPMGLMKRYAGSVFHRGVPVSMLNPQRMSLVSALGAVMGIAMKMKCLEYVGGFEMDLVKFALAKDVSKINVAPEKKDGYMAFRKGVKTVIRLPDELDQERCFWIAMMNTKYLEPGNEKNRLNWKVRCLPGSLMLTKEIVQRNLLLAPVIPENQAAIDEMIKKIIKSI